MEVSIASCKLNLAVRRRSCSGWPAPASRCCRGGLAALARAWRGRCRGSEAAAALERDERGVESADRRRRRLDADRQRRPRLRHVADRRRRQARGQPPRLVQGATPRRRASARSARGRGGDRLVEDVLRRRGVRPRRRQAHLGAAHRSDGRPDAGPRQAQPRDASPVTDGTLVFAWFGTGQLVALDRDGAVVWQRHLAKENRRRSTSSGGTAARRCSIGDLADPALRSPPRVVPARGRQARPGRTGGRRTAARDASSYSTPLVIEGAFGTELIVNSTERIDAYDREDRRRSSGTRARANRFAVPTPVFHDGVIYASRGYRSGPYMAIRPGGTRRRHRDARRLARPDRRAVRLVAAVLRRRRLHGERRRRARRPSMPATGERVWQERVDGVFSASPVAGGGHVYFVSENGDTVVVKAGRAPQVVAETRSASAPWRRRRSRTARSSSAPTIMCSASARRGGLP